MANYYEHSGKFAPQGPILGLVGGIAVSVPVALLYDYALFSVPYLKLRFLLPMVFGMLVGGACGAMMCLGKVRSKQLAAAVAFVTSFAGLYVSWVAWLAGVLHFVNPTYPFPGALHPLQIWNAVVAVNAHGTWSSGGDAPMHGTTLWLVWAGEALLVLGFGVMAGVALVQRRPFCERCGQWCKKQCKLYFAPSVQPADLKAQLESGNLGTLDKLAPGNKKQPHYRIDVHTCSVCQQLNTLTLEQIFPRNNKTLMNKLLLSAEQASALRNMELHQRATAANAVLASAK